MTRPPTTPRHSALFGAVLAFALVGCLDSDEERAVRAYDSLDFAAARVLATGMADAGNPRGHELLALMAAQGLGQSVDYAGALAAIDRAVALDAAFDSTRAVILDRVAADRAAAEQAFANERYDRAWRLAAPLAAFGDETGKALETELVTGHYVALPGSDMSWRSFRDRCSGNIRFEDENRGQELFDDRCRGRAATWDGTVTRRQGEIVQIKMRPGRAGARPDLTLDLAHEPDRDLARPGVKVRFAGTIAERGSPHHPDRLAAARLIGPAPLTPGETARAEARLRQTVAGACQRLVETVYRAGHMPAWAVETERRVIAGGSPRSRAFYLQVGIVSGLDRFEPAPGGGWRGAFDGTVSIQSTVARTAQVTAFTAECALDPTWRRGADPARHGSLTFLTMSEPSVESASARMRR